MPTSRKTIATLLVIALAAGSAAAQEAQRPPGPAMMVHFDYYPKDRPQIHALEHRLASAIKRADAGELGETEIHIDGNDGYLFNSRRRIRNNSWNPSSIWLQLHLIRSVLDEASNLFDFGAVNPHRPTSHFRAFHQFRFSPTFNRPPE
ncbi:MAG TPA: hypothetical protein VIH96_03580 [Paraburkholderia sp.]|jgi:hypothetical protein